MPVDGISRIAGCALGVASARSADPVHEAARVAFKNHELYAQSLVSYQEFMADHPEEVRRFAASPACLDVLLITGLLGNQAIGPERYFCLRAFTWVHSPLTLAVVPKDGLAYWPGLRAGDTLVPSGGPTPISLCSLKADLPTNAGRRIRLVVLRGGRRREWNVNIPRKLSE